MDWFLLTDYLIGDPISIPSNEPSITSNGQRAEPDVYTDMTFGGNNGSKYQYTIIHVT